jgi:hypothetical protein
LDPANLALTLGAILASAVFLAGSIVLCIATARWKAAESDRSEFLIGITRVHTELLELMAQASHLDVVRFRESVAREQRQKAATEKLSQIPPSNGKGAC